MLRMHVLLGQWSSQTSPDAGTSSSWSSSSPAGQRMLPNSQQILLAPGSWIANGLGELRGMTSFLGDKPNCFDSSFPPRSSLMPSDRRDITSLSSTSLGSFCSLLSFPLTLVHHQILRHSPHSFGSDRLLFYFFRFFAICWVRGRSVYTRYLIYVYNIHHQNAYPALDYSNCPVGHCGGRTSSTPPPTMEE